MTFPSTDLDVIVEAFFGADLTSTDPLNDWTPTDLSDRLIRKPIVISRGRGPGQKTFQPARCVLWLDNTDGALTPLLATSTYYPNWDLNVPLRLAVDNVGASPEYTRFRGHVDSIAPVYIPGSGGPISAVHITASGVSRRLSQGAREKSALYRSTSDRRDAAPIAWWPCEGDATSAVPGGLPLITYADSSHTVDFDAAAFGGSAGSVDLIGLGQLEGPIPASRTNEWRFEYSFNLGTVAFDTLSNIDIWPAGPASIVWSPGHNSSGRATLIATTNIGGVVSTPVLSSFSSTYLFDGLDHHALLTVRANGTGADWTYYIDDVLVGSGTAALGLSDPVPPPNRFTANYQGAFLSAPSGDAVYRVGSFAFWDSATLPAGTHGAAARGYPGETDDTRIARVLAEEGVICSVTGTSLTQLGPQPVAAMLDVCRDAEKVGRGILAEALDTWGISYFCRDERENASPELTVNLATYNTTEGTSAEVLAPIYDDQRIRNEWEIDSDFGKAVEFDAAHIRKRGRYDDQDSAVVASLQGARDLAGWFVREGTVAELRYPITPVDLGANYSTLLPTWLEIDLGARVDRSNQPTTIGTTTIQGSLEGYEETIDARAWSAKLNAPFYAPWQVGILAGTSGDTDPDLGRVCGDDAAAIRVAINSAALSMDVDPNFYRWTTAADDFDPDLRIRLGGEVVEVSGISTTAGTYVAAGAASHADNAAVTPAMYAGATVRDLICVFAAIRSSGTGTLQTPTDYTRLPVFAATDNVQLFAKVHDGSEPDPTVTPSGGAAGDTVSAVTFGLRGTPCTLDDLADIVVDSLAILNASAANIAYPGLYPRWVEGCIVLALGWKQDDWTSVATLSGFTGEAVDASTTTGSDQGLVVDYLIQTTPAVVNEGSFTVTGGANAISRGALVAIASGYQTFTISNRSVNGVTKSHAAGTTIEVEDPLVLTL